MHAVWHWLLLLIVAAAVAMTAFTYGTLKHPRPSGVAIFVAVLWWLVTLPFWWLWNSIAGDE